MRSITVRSLPLAALWNPRNCGAVFCLSTTPSLSITVSILTTMIPTNGVSCSSRLLSRVFALKYTYRSTQRRGLKLAGLKPFFGLLIFPPFSEFCSPLVPLRYFALSFPGILYNFSTQRRDYPSPPNIPAGQPFFVISSQVTAAKVSLLFHAPLVCIPLKLQCAGAHAHRFRGWAVFRLW